MTAWAPEPGTTHFDLDRSGPTRFTLPPMEEVEAMTQETGWAKYRSTEFVSFLLIFLVATVALFAGRATFELWMVSAMGSAVICGTVRTVKSLKILGLEFEGYREEREASGPQEPPP